MHVYNAKLKSQTVGKIFKQKYTTDLQVIQNAVARPSSHAAARVSLQVPRSTSG